MERKGDSSKEFLSLARALESDTEWHRTVMHATYEVAINNRVAPSKPSIYDTTHLRDSDDESRRQTKFPCPHCKDLINNYNKHVMNTCVNFIERHNWRKSNIINYIDTTLDHNKFKIFCDLPDRRTSGGKKLFWTMDIERNKPLNRFRYSKRFHCNINSIIQYCTGWYK